MGEQTVVEAWGGRYDGLQIALPGDPAVVKFPVAVPLMAYLFDGAPLEMRVEVYPIVRLHGRSIVIAPGVWPNA